MTLSQEYLQSRFNYNATTGDLIWKPQPLFHKCWNVRYARKPAGTSAKFNRNYYMTVTLVGKKHLNHRLIWVIIYGSIDSGLQIDHINGNGLDNRLKNLRLVNNQENHKNIKRVSTNSSGHTGVSYDQQNGQWYAYITHNQVMKNLGRYTTRSEAIIARKSAEAKYGFHSNHGRN